MAPSDVTIAMTAAATTNKTFLGKNLSRVLFDALRCPGIDGPIPADGITQKAYPSLEKRNPSSPQDENRAASVVAAGVILAGTVSLLMTLPVTFTFDLGFMVALGILLGLGTAFGSVAKIELNRYEDTVARVRADLTKLRAIAANLLLSGVGRPRHA